MDGIRATPMQYPILGLLADKLKKAQQFAVAPGGYANPPAEILLNLLGIPAVQQTMERVAYGEPLTTGRGMTTQIRPEVAEAALTLLPVAGKTAQVAERGAMAAGRAGERLAERVVPQIMERGGMPAGLLEGMSSRTVSPLTVYHGSPAKFTKFDPTKIGSGEGAQAYGYGHYVAQNPEIAQGYASNITFKNNPLSYSGNLTPESDVALQQLGYFYKNADDIDLSNLNSIKQFIKNSSDMALEDGNEKLSKAISKLDPTKISINKGSLYTIDLPDEQIAKMLDWDKPLSQMTEKEKEIFNPLYQSLLNSNNPYVPKELKTIGDVFQYSRAANPNLEQKLMESGIPGIRYLDQGSRGTGEGTSNFVVFPGNEDMLTILKRNGGLLGP